MSATPRVPKYRRHPNGQAFIESKGKRYYLGIYDSKESRERYRGFVNQILARGVILPSVRLDGSATMDECVLHYLTFAEGYYGATAEFHHMKTVLRDLSEHHGSAAAIKFGPRALSAIRDLWILRGWCRNNINQQVGRVRRFFRWCGSQELIPGEASHRLACLEPLRPGKSKAKESKRIKPPTRGSVEAMLPYLLPHIAAMVQVQYWCGMRPQDICRMRPCDIDRTGAVWLYKVPEHKNAWRGQQLVKAIPARAQAILEPYLSIEPEAFIFSPQLSAVALKRVNRKRRSKVIREAYSTCSYRQAIEYGFAKVKREGTVIPHWHPNQLRHLIATEVSQLLGQQKAQRWLGHQDLETTAIYAESEITELVAIATELDRRWAS